MIEDNLINPREGIDRHLQLEVRAQKLLDLIETRCIHVRDGSKQANQTYFEELPLAGSGSVSAANASKLSSMTTQEFFRILEAEPLKLNELSRYTKHWKALIPNDAETQAAVIKLLAQKYPLRQGSYSKLQAALGFDDPQVQQTFLELYEQPLEMLFEQSVDILPAAGTHPAEAKANALNEVALEWDLMDEVNELEWVNLPSGGVLYQEGEQGDAFFILISGRLREVVLQGEGERIMAEIGRGEMVGAIEVLTGEARTTRVYATRDSELIRISQYDLHRLAEKRPQIMKRMVGYLAVRLKSQVTPLKKSENNIVSFALIRARNAALLDVPAFTSNGLEDFPARFAEALSVYGPTLLLNSEQLDRQAGQGWAQTPLSDEGSSWLAAYLSEQEAHYRYVIYEADAGPSPWTRRCLRQADRALIVAESGEDPQPGEVEALLQHMEVPAEAELVLVHPDRTWRPSGTQHWLAPRNLKGHHHLRLSNTEDIRRLVRRLTGRALGLVLSGGGARGYAHIGVIRALKEAGLQVDSIGGTSMGSIIGALIAMDADEAEIMKLAQEMSSSSKLFDFTLPLVSFFKSEKATNVLKSMFGDIRIEDLWRPYFCVSSSLTHAKSKVHVQGPLWEAVRASSAIPGVFSPYLSDGELLVDGAVLNNLPVDLMQDFAGCGPIAAVNVFPEVDLVREYDFGNSVSGWEVLLRKLNPFTEDHSVPLIFESIIRVIALNDVHLATTKSQMCELYITPHVERFGILEFKSYKQIIEIGYRAGKEAIEAWSRGESPAVFPANQKEAPLNMLQQSLAELETMLDRMALAVN